MVVSEGSAWQSLGPEYPRFTEQAEVFWRHNGRASGDRVILVDLMNQEMRMAIRCLSIAAALTRCEPARLVALVNPEPEWLGRVWTFYNPERLLECARAYGVSDVVDLAALAEASPGDVVRVAGRDVRVRELALPEKDVAAVADSTAARLLKVPRVTQKERVERAYAGIVARSFGFGRAYEALLAGFDVVALVTSHVDYAHWGLGAAAATAAGVPTIHAQTTGTLKAYAVFPEPGDARPFRQQITRDVARFFDAHVWPRRDLLRGEAALTSRRSKSNLGRPSWWRAQGGHSEVSLETPEERSALRGWARRSAGFAREQPVITVFNHAVSDALGANVEHFEDLAGWFTATCAFARRHPEVNWLFLDHPSQSRYDDTGFFDATAERYRSPTSVFLPSMALSKNQLWALTDLAVTVRGSVSNEFPAYGIPALQVGWSEWSHVGLGMLADSPWAYRRRLRRSIAVLRAGGRLITDEQIERARLWAWFYRAATDVQTSLVQHWECQAHDDLYRTLRVTMSYVESTGDPLFTSVRRMWRRRDPFLTRFDFLRDDDGLADELGLADVPCRRPPLHDPDRGNLALGAGLEDGRRTFELPCTIRSGADAVVAERFVRGRAVLGRPERGEAVLGVKVARGDGEVAVRLALRVDERSDAWWRRAVGADEGAAPPEREVEVVTPDGRRSSVRLSAGEPRSELVVPLDASRFDARGLVVLVLRSGEGDGLAPDGLAGVEVVSLTIG